MRLWSATLGFANWKEGQKKPFGMFLLLYTILWCLPGFLIAGVSCLILQPEWYNAVTALVIATGVPGMLLGFFGGALFLMRMD